jgi:hypothetical protein
MNSQITQNLQEKLARRVQRLMSANSRMFPSYLQQFLRFFHDHPIYSSIGNSLLINHPETEEIARVIIEGDKHQLSESEEEIAALAYQLMKTILESISTTTSLDIEEFENIIYGIDCAYNRTPASDTSRRLETFRNIFILAFHDYVHEQLDEQKIVLGLLIRYKHRCEWFHREDLNHVAQDNSRKSEKLLSLNLYSYLHDQGLNFHIEPSSITGEIDLIAAQGSNDPLLADAKVFDANSRGKSYICKGFNQIYTYTQQYNESCGYLIIFRITDRDLHFSLPQQFHGIPAITYNHKTIFLITIDICHHEKSVSQRKPLEAITITQEDLISEVEEPEDGTGDLVR